MGISGFFHDQYPVVLFQYSTGGSIVKLKEHSLPSQAGGTLNYVSIIYWLSDFKQRA